MPLASLYGVSRALLFRPPPRTMQQSVRAVLIDIPSSITIGLVCYYIGRTPFFDHVKNSVAMSPKEAQNDRLWGRILGGYGIWREGRF